MNTSAPLRTLQRASRYQRQLWQAAKGQQNAVRFHHTPTAPPSLLRSCTCAPARPQPTVTSALPQRRHESSTGPRPLTDRGDLPLEKTNKDEVPSYQMTFTCRKCVTRSTHRLTQQAYHYGTCLITCPGCKGRHLISDHLRIFSDHSITLEDILRDKGQFLQRGSLGEDGDVEFYDPEGKEIGTEHTAEEQVEIGRKLEEQARLEEERLAQSASDSEVKDMDYVAMMEKLMQGTEKEKEVAGKIREHLESLGWKFEVREKTEGEADGKQ